MISNNNKHKKNATIPLYLSHTTFHMAKGKNVELENGSSSTAQLSIAESAQALEEQTSTSRPLPWHRRLYSNLSSSRQIFCLFCIFDFLFTFFLWIIYAQVCVTRIYIADIDTC